MEAIVGSYERSTSGSSQKSGSPEFEISEGL